MFIRSIFLALIALIFWGTLFSQEVNLPSKIYIKSNGSVEGSFYFLDELNIGHPIEITKIGSVTMDALNPLLLFKADRKQTPYLLFPGDSLLLAKDKNNETILKLIHADSIKENQLNFFRSVIEKIGIIRTIPIVNISSGHSSADISKRDSVADVIYGQRMSYFVTYSSIHTLSDEFKKFCEVLFKSYQLKEKFYGNNKQQLELITYYRKNLKSYFSFFSNDSNVTNSAYREAVLAFFNFLTMQYSDREKYNFAKKKFTGKTKDFLLTRVAIDWFNKDLKSSDEIILKQQSDCNDSTYRKIALQFFDKTKKDMAFTFKSTQFIKSCLVNNTLDTISWKDLIAINQGNLIYIDFWASWCTPCRREMPYSELLREKLKDEKVTFVYISIDKKKSDWELAADDIGIGKYGNSYIVLNPEKDEFIQELKVEQIPRYVLLDKLGQILMRDTYRPSDSLLLQQINKALKN
ncbi:MAG: TlpA disulfide reductase family protein [Agriterribacter sp.]